MDSFTKQPSEEFWVSVDFEDVLEGSETIVASSSSATAEDNAGNDATSDVITSGTLTVSGTELRVHVKGGSVFTSPYKLTLKAVTNSSPANIWEKNIKMWVKEI